MSTAALSLSKLSFVSITRRLLQAINDIGQEEFVAISRSNCENVWITGLRLLFSADDNESSRSGSTRASGFAVPGAPRSSSLGGANRNNPSLGRESGFQSTTSLSSRQSQNGLVPADSMASLASGPPVFSPMMLKAARMKSNTAGSCLGQRSSSASVASNGNRNSLRQVLQDKRGT